MFFCSCVAVKRCSSWYRSMRSTLTHQPVTPVLCRGSWTTHALFNSSKNIMVQYDWCVLTVLLHSTMLSNPKQVYLDFFYWYWVLHYICTYSKQVRLLGRITDYTYICEWLCKIYTQPSPYFHQIHIKWANSGCGKRQGCHQLLYTFSWNDEISEQKEKWIQRRKTNWATSYFYTYSSRVGGTQNNNKV